MSNEELVTRIRAGIDTADNMLMLWQQNKGIIAKLALRYRGYEDIEDLEQQGYLGLCDAVEHYDASAGVSFLTYAVHWIRHSMQRYIENNGSCIRFPSGRKHLMNQYKRFCRGFYQEHGREPEKEEIQDRFGLNDKEYKSLVEAVIRSDIESLNKPAQETDSNVEIGDCIADKSNMEEDVICRTVQEQMKQELWELVDSLPEEQPEVIRLRYQKGLTLKEIGEMYGVTQNRVRTIEENGLRKLRVQSRRKRLEPYYEELVAAYAYHGSSLSMFRHTWTSSTELTAFKLLGSDTNLILKK